MPPSRPTTSGQFVGSAVVSGAIYHRDSTTLQLLTFTGESIDYTLAGVPDQPGVAEFQAGNLRPISVKILQSAKRCSVLFLGARGAESADVTLGTALALLQAGVHTLVDGGLRIGLPCSMLTVSAAKLG